MNLSAWIDRNAGLTPGKTAVRFQGHDVSYAALAAMVEQLAAALAASKVRRGDCVAFLGFNSPEMLALLFACARLGALYMPLNWRLAGPEHQQMLQDCPPKVLIVEAAFAAQTDALKEVPLGDGIRTTLDGIELVASGPSADGWTSWDEFLGRATGIAPRDAGYRRRHAAADLLHLGLHRQAQGRVADAARHRSAMPPTASTCTSLGTDDVILTTLPLFHVGGLNNLRPRRRCRPAAPWCCTPSSTPTPPSTRSSTDGITLTVLVPAQLDMMMAHPRWAGADFSHLRMITTGSTIVPHARHPRRARQRRAAGAGLWLDRNLPDRRVPQGRRRHAQGRLHRARRHALPLATGRRRRQ
jgi:fatty-acyl-CoA synthase